MADLLLGEVFANPVLRGKEIITDPVFQAYLERNQILPKALLKARKKQREVK